jgi:hypothetical protein
MDNQDFLKRFFQSLKTNRKTQIITIAAVAILALVIVLVYYFTGGKESRLLGLEKEKNVRHLDGMVVKPDEANLPVIAVIIENLITVRPQAGLQEAGLVYEALAEGGITRFLALYAGHKADLIGPVRSLRPYYLEWCAEYEAMCSHIGGSPEALQAVSGLGLKDLNAMYESKYFWRDETIPAPHNLFTKSELLELASRDKKFDQEPKYAVWKFADAPKLDALPQDEKFIKIGFSGPDYAVEYKYNREKNEYLRFNGGAVHKDQNTDKQISVKNVLVVKLPTKITDDKGRAEIDVVGEHKAYMFSNGQAYEGKAVKKDREGRTYFYHNDGKEHEFVRGNIWVEVVSEDKSVEFN